MDIEEIERAVLLISYLDGGSVLHDRDTLIDQGFSVLPSLTNLNRKDGRVN